jgi:hypothetical protein
MDTNKIIKRVYSQMGEIKSNTIILTTPAKVASGRWLSVNFAFAVDRFNELNNLQNLNIIRKLRRLGTLGNNLLNFNFEVNPNFDEIYSKLHDIEDNPFYGDATRYNKFLKLLKTKASSNLEDIEPLLFKHGSVSVDGAKFELKIYDTIFRFASNNNQFKFIFTLVKAQGDLVNYKDLYINSGIMAPKEQELLNPQDYAENLKHIKNNLATSLKKKYSKDSKEYQAVETLIKNIKSIEGEGYKLQLF